MRKIDYVGSQPIASVLLFASKAHVPDTEGDLEGETGSFEMSATRSDSHGEGGIIAMSSAVLEKRDANDGINNA